MSEWRDITVEVFKEGEPYRLVTLKETNAEDACRRATAAIFMADLRADEDPQLREAYTAYEVTDAEARARRLEEFAEQCRAEGDTREAEEAEAAAQMWRGEAELTGISQDRSEEDAPFGDPFRGGFQGSES